MNIDQRILTGIERQPGARLRLIGSIASGLAGGGLVLAQAWLLSRVIARVFLDRLALAEVLPMFAGLLAVMLARSGLTYLAETLASAAAIQIKGALRRQLMAHFFDCDPQSLSGQATGSLAATVVQGVEALDTYISQYLPQIVLAGAVPLLMLLFVFPLDWISGLVLLLTAPLIPIFMLLIGKVTAVLTKKQFTTLSRMSAFFLDTLQGLSVLKTLGQSHNQAERIARVSEDYRAATMNVLRVAFLSALVLELTGTLSTAVIAVEIGVRLLYGRLAFEQAFFLLVIAPEFYLPLRTLGLRFHAGMAGVTAAKEIFNTLLEPAEVLPELVEGRGSRETKAQTSYSRNLLAVDGQALTSPDLRQPGWTLTMRGIGVTYPNRQRDALHAIDFTLRAGEQVALVGESGSGKSTLTGLLLGLVRPRAGQIWWNETPWDTIDRDGWRAQVAWVPQRPAIFADSLADNLRIAKIDASRENMRAALAQAGLAELGEDLARPAGALSGGQAQRLALARAFLRDAPLLVLDEPTAHLDPEHEAALQAAIAALRRARTVLLIAHSIPTVMQADRIVVLAHGRMVESGTHTDLLARSGEYARLVRAARGELE